MKNNLNKLAPIFLRVGVALVFIWFGSQQLLHPGSWIGFIPKELVTLSGLSVWTFVALNGAMEVVFGLCMLVGFFTTISAFILGVHMLFITIDVGYGPTGVRDFAVTVGALAVFLTSFGSSTSFSLDRHFDKDVVALKD